MATQMSSAQLQQANAAARAMILANALKMTQVVAGGTVLNPGSGANIINIIPRAVGLAQKFTVELTATFSSGASSLNATTLNVANLLSQVIFNDLQNYTRIQTAGWHVNLINSIKEGMVFGSSNVGDVGDTVAGAYQNGPGYGNIMNQSAANAGGIGSGSGIIFCPASISPTSTAQVKMTYEIPLAYSDRDLRGACYLGVVNSTSLLQLTINPAPVVAAASDPTLAVFQGKGSTTGTITSLTYVIYQHWWDQLPMGKQGPILPAMDLSTVYELKNTSLSGMTANSDFPIPYSNYRDFLSTAMIWDNAGVINSTPGSDINYFALQSANFTNIWKIDAFLNALHVRKLLKADTPNGLYYFSHRNRPLSTIQYGNLELLLNETVAAAAGQQVLMGYEDFGLQNTITGAGSLAAG